MLYGGVIYYLSYGLYTRQIVYCNGEEPQE